MSKYLRSCLLSLPLDGSGSSCDQCLHNDTEVSFVENGSHSRALGGGDMTAPILRVPGVWLRRMDQSGPEAAVEHVRGQVQTGHV